MDEFIKTILDSQSVGGLATVDSNGEPSLCPLHFVRLKNKIYFLTDEKSEHIMNTKNSKTSEFVVWDDKKRGVYIKSEIMKLTNFESVESEYSKKFHGFKPKLENPAWFEMQIGKLDEHKTTENWRHFIA